MSKYIGSVLVLLLLIPCGGAQASKGVHIIGSYLRVEEFNNLQKSDKAYYAMGFYNGMMASTFLDAEDEEVQMLHDCVQDMDIGQLTAILDKYVKENPEVWHQPLAPHTLFALLNVCPDLNKKVGSKHTTAAK